VTLEQHNLIVALLCVPAVVALWFLVGWLRTRSRTGHPWSHHHRQYRWLHHGSLAGIGAALILAATGAGIVYVIVHHGGGVLVPGRHIVPPIHRRGGGPVPDGYVSPDLTYYTRPDDTAAVDQSGTLACCGITTVRLDSLNRAISRREYATPLYPQSGYRPWYYATNGQNIGTDPLDDVAALNAHGGEALAYWPLGGYPAASDAAHVVNLGNASVTWRSYNAGGIGRAGLDDLEWRLDHKQPVGLLWAVHYDGDHDYGLTYTWDGGAFAYFHCLVAVQWARDLPGLGGEAIKVWNSYGTGYGQGGYIWLPAAVVERHGLGTFTEAPGSAVKAWLPPPPTATPRPTSRPTPRPTPRPTATPRPGACVPRVGVLKANANLHATPVLGSPATAGERAGQRLSTLCPGQPDSTHWTYRSDPTGRQGWLLRSALKTSLK